MSDLIGRTLGHYRITAKIGEGGMGEVYRAHDERLNREVAIKVIHQKVAQDAERLARFEREARALASLNHPNIAQIYGLETADLPFDVIPRSADSATRNLGGGLQDHSGGPPAEIPRRGAGAPLARDDRRAGAEAGSSPTPQASSPITFLVMELLEGQNLRARVPSSGLPWQKVVEIGAAIADGLAAAHGKGIVHRDLKPENVFVIADGRVKILDFGLARVQEEVALEAETATLTPAGTETGTILGTVAYMAPEQVKGNPADHRSDIFALGCVLYEMVSGRRPFEGDTTVETMAAILKEEPRQLSSTGATLPNDLERSIHRCLEKSPDARFQSASDLAFGLRSIGTGPAVMMQTPTGVVLPVAEKRRRWLTVAAAAAIVAAGVVGWWMLRQPESATEESRAPTSESQTPMIEEWLVAVEPFENRTGDPSLDFIGPSLVDRVVDGLGRVTQGLHSLPKVLVVLADDGDLDPLAGEEALTVNRGRILVTGSYARRDSELEVVTQVRDPASQRVLFTGDPVEVSPQLRSDETDQLTQMVMGAVGIHLHVGLANVSHVARYDAFHGFLAGVEQCWGKGSVRDGEDRIEASLQMDSEFLRPAMFLAGNHLFRRRREMVPPYLDHIRQRADRLTEFEGLEFEVYEAWYEGSMGRALHAARRMRELVPWDLQAIALHAKMAEHLNRPNEVMLLAYVHDYLPRVFARYRRVAMTHAARSIDRLGRYEELLELARRMRRDAPGDTIAFSSEAIALAGLDRLDELDALVEACRSFPGGECDVAWVTMRVSWFLAANGNPEKCIEYGNRVADHLESLPEDEFMRRQGHYLTALRTAERWDEYGALAWKLAESADEGSGAQKYYLSCAGMAAGHSGERETAEAVISGFEASGDFFYAAQVAGYLGDLDRAIDYLRRGLEHQEGMTYSSLYRWDIDLQPLWGFPPFEEMVRPKG